MRRPFCLADRAASQAWGTGCLYVTEDGSWNREFLLGGREVVRPMGSMINGVPNPIHAATPSVVRSGAARNEEAESGHRHPDRADAVELSELARARMARDEAGPIRHDLVERIRAEIAAGTYLTDDKIDAVVERLHQNMIAAA